MPARIVPLVTNEFYHIVNRGVGAIPVFKNSWDYQRFIQTFQFYQHDELPMRFSKFLALPKQEREDLFLSLSRSSKLLVEIIAYCLMPNHFHFLLKQKEDGGVMKFIRLATDSYSKYFNTKYKRKGTLFEGRFKAVRVETEEQLLHLSRYIHLNPYSGYLIKDLKKLVDYPYFSLPEYLGLNENKICQKQTIFSFFGSQAKYRDFINDQADYQRNLELVKHQLLER